MLSIDALHAWGARASFETYLMSWLMTHKAVESLVWFDNFVTHMTNCSEICISSAFKASPIRTQALFVQFVEARAARGGFIKCDVLLAAVAHDYSIRISSAFEASPIRTQALFVQFAEARAARGSFIKCNVLLAAVAHDDSICEGAFEANVLLCTLLAKHTLASCANLRSFWLDASTRLAYRSEK